jgi:hypothetical protein
MQGNEKRDDNKPTGQAKGALARVAKALSDPESRRSFMSDPHGTVPGYAALPESVRQTLEGLSPEELDVLSRTHQKLADAGFYVDVEDEHGGGQVSFF